MSKKFTVIVADPPYGFKDSLKMSDVARSAQSQYQTMSISEIRQLPIKSITDDDGAVLALWVPSCLLQEGLDIMKDWGFAHKQTYVWVKTKKDVFSDFNKWIRKNVIKKSILNFEVSINGNKAYTNAFDKIIQGFKDINVNNFLSFGMGRLFRQTHELCLIGTSNNKIYKKLKNKSQRSVSLDENKKHSAKPELLQNSLEIMFPDCEKIELFARRQRQDWVCLGNQVCNGEDIRVSLSKL